MPLKTGKLHDELRTVSFRFLGEQVKVTYRLSALTPELRAWVQDQDGKADSTPGWIERVIVSWDLEDDDGNVLPATKEVIEQYGLPTPFLGAIVTEVYADANPKELRTSASPSGVSLRSGAGH